MMPGKNGGVLLTTYGEVEEAERAAGESVIAKGQELKARLEAADPPSELNGDEMTLVINSLWKKLTHYNLSDDERYKTQRFLDNLESLRPKLVS